MSGGICLDERNGREGEAEQEAAGIAEEYAGGIGVVPEKSQERADKCETNDQYCIVCIDQCVIAVSDKY